MTSVDNLKGRINFFLGAGASKAFDLPSMKDLPVELHKQIKSEGDADQIRLFENLYTDIVEKLGKEKLDIEAMMSVIVNLRNQEHLQNDLEDFTLFLLKKFDISFEQMAGGTYNPETYSALERTYKEFIRRKCLIGQNSVSKILQIYKNLFDHMSILIREPLQLGQKYPTLEEQKNELQNIIIFTTNYDTAIEVYCRNTDYAHLDTGAIKEYGKTRNFVNADQFVQRYIAKESRLRLIKLHGSINWIRNEEGKIEEEDYFINFDQAHDRNLPGYVKGDVMVYPLSQKELYLHPFVQFFSLLDTELRKYKIWIVIGYSFRDLFIRKMFENSIDQIDKIVLVHPDIEEVASRFNNETRKKIIGIKSKFGNDDYDQINRDIMMKIRDS